MDSHIFADPDPKCCGFNGIRKYVCLESVYYAFCKGRLEAYSESESGSESESEESDGESQIRIPLQRQVFMRVFFLAFV